MRQFDTSCPTLPQLEHLEICGPFVGAKDKMATLTSLQCLLMLSETHATDYLAAIPWRSLKDSLQHMRLYGASADDYPSSAHAVMLASQGRTDCPFHANPEFDYQFYDLC